MSKSVESHIELIDPLEKLTGYRGPTKPASRLDLLVNAKHVLETWPTIPYVVWKLLRRVPAGRQCPQPRRLTIDGKRLPCEVIGSVEHWWFVSVDADRVIEVLNH